MHKSERNRKSQFLEIGVATSSALAVSSFFVIFILPNETGRFLNLLFLLLTTVASALLSVALEVLIREWAVRAAIDSNFTYPRFWKAFSWLIPRKTRKRVFDPAYADLMLDYCEMPRPATRLGKAYRHFVFVAHTILLVVDTLRATAFAKIIDLAVGAFRSLRT